MFLDTIRYRQKFHRHFLDFAILLDRMADDLHSKGFALHKAGAFSDGVAFYNQALLLQPDHFESIFHRALALDKINQHSSAIVDYTKAISLQPENPIPYYNRLMPHLNNS